MPKQIKIKNYFLLLGIIIITFLVFLYVFSFLKQYKDAKIGTPVITEVLTEVKYDNLDSFLRERDFVVIYMCTTSENICRNFETKFKNLILEEYLSDYIVYLNLGNEKIEDDLLNKVYVNYKHSDLIKKLNNYPSLLIFSNGKIINLLSPNNLGKLSISSVREFLEGYDIIND